MNAPKPTQLSLMQRAYRAAEPNVAEVQAGVRRARLALRQPRRARTGRGKPLMLLVLGLSGMAYAYPSALRELVEHAAPVLPHDGRSASHTIGAHPAPAVEQRTKSARPLTGAAAPGTGANPTPAVAANPTPGAANALAPVSAPDSNEAALPAPGAAKVVAEHEPASQAEQSASSARPRNGAASGAAGTQAKMADSASRASRGKASPASKGQTASQWGSVRRALVQGDEQAALTALGSLARSEDPQTRDKAKLGRAQLLMARGEQTQACSIARELNEHGTDARIERQAQGLLKSCTR